MAGEYPKRPRFFSYRFGRLMAKVCLANEIGPVACWMLTVIANTEDAKHYTDHVTYFNEQLFPLVGVGSVDALDRVRKKAIDAGWLDYIPGRKGIAGRYCVKIPDRYTDIPDGPCDEKPSEYIRENAEECAETTARNVRRQPRDNREKSAEHSSLSLTLNTPLPPKGGESAFDLFWEAYPRKYHRPSAQRSWQALSPSPELVEKIMMAVDNQRQSEAWIRSDGRYIPSPAKWIRGQMWNNTTTTNDSENLHAKILKYTSKGST